MGMRATGLVCALAVLLGIVACGTTTSVAGTPAAAPPPPTEFPSVLSTTTADSSRETTRQALAEELRARPVALPHGHHELAVVEEEGPGSFRAAVPDRFTLRWRPGEPFEEMLGAAARRDESWADGAMETMIGEPPDGGLRLVVLDVSRADELATLQVTVEPARAETGDALAELGRADFAEAGYAIDAARAVVANGIGGAYLEFSDSDQVYVQVRVLDPSFAAMWALTCYGPIERRAEVRQACATAGTTFELLPVIVP
jgi:hypothetical protein